MHPLFITHKKNLLGSRIIKPTAYNRDFTVFYTLGQKEVTVKPVLSGPVLNGHPLLNGQLQKSRKFFFLTTLNVTSIKRSPLLNGRGHLLQSPSEGISVVFTCIKRSLH